VNKGQVKLEISKNSSRA